MSSETHETTVVTAEAVISATTANASAAVEEGKKKRHDWDHHIHRDDVRQIWKECKEESFWYRALPISLGSMAVTGGLIYNGVWKTSKRFGPFPKLAVAGILGYVVGKASYVTTCRNKFERLGPVLSEKGFGPGAWPSFGGRGFGPGHRHCHHVCEDCKKKQAQAAPVELVKS